MIGAGSWGQGDSIRDELLAPSLMGIRRRCPGQTRRGVGGRASLQRPSSLIPGPGTGTLHGGRGSPRPRESRPALCSPADVQDWEKQDGGPH